MILHRSKTGDAERRKKTQAEDRIAALLPDPHDTVASIQRQAMDMHEAFLNELKREMGVEDTESLA